MVSGGAFRANCHRIATGDSRDRSLGVFGSQGAGERCLYNLGGPFVGVAKQVSVDCQRDRRVGVTDPPADGDDVEAGRDELRNMRVPPGMQRYIG
jgi:hypothetical protein